MAHSDTDIQIIIPMTGEGARFKGAGYQRLKPFICIHDRPMIEWVVRLFPEDEHQIRFVCRQDHLDSIPYMAPTLQQIAPTAEILTIHDWVKKGPVYDILNVADSIHDDRPVLISYCDYYMHWDYRAFKQDVMVRDCDGAVPCYSGFHPHLIPIRNLYASCNVDSDDDLIEIREKFSWTKDKTKARHSPGVYYFKSGAIMKQYCRQMVMENDHVNDEFYASLPFNYLVRDGRKVWCPVNVEQFCQWGTPQDLEDYVFWVDTLTRKKVRL